MFARAPGLVLCFFESYDEWLRGGGRLWPYPFDDHDRPIPSTTTTVCSLRMMTPPLTLTTAMQIAAAYGGDEL